MVKSMAKEFTLGQTAIATRVNIRMERNMVGVSTIRQTVIAMKENMLMVRNMEKELIYG
jgi:heterodisulfide reductase subunit C